MNSMLLFVARVATTKAFWGLVVTAFLGTAMWQMHGVFRDRIFQEAVESLRSGGWKDFRGGKW